MNGAQCEVRAVDNMTIPLEMTRPGSYKPMTFQRHQELTALVYRVKKFIDAEGGLSETEGCEFGRLIQSILYLK